MHWRIFSACVPLVSSFLLRTVTMCVAQFVRMVKYWQCFQHVVLCPAGFPMIAYHEVDLAQTHPVSSQPLRQNAFESYLWETIQS